MGGGLNSVHGPLTHVGGGVCVCARGTFMARERLRYVGGVWGRGCFFDVNGPLTYVRCGGGVGGLGSITFMARERMLGVGGSGLNSVRGPLAFEALWLTHAGHMCVQHTCVGWVGWVFKHHV